MSAQPERTTAVFSMMHSDDMGSDYVQVDHPSTTKISTPKSKHGAQSGCFFSSGLGTAIGPKNILSQPAKPFYTIIKTDLLIPGDGPPLKDATLVIEDSLIAWLGKTADLPSKYVVDHCRRFSAPYLMPGLWDVHTHLSGAPDGSYSYLAAYAAHPAACGARLARQCWDALQLGCTSVRDLAGYGCEIAQAVKDGSVVGPNIYSAGAGLSQLAGHGDMFEVPAGEAILAQGVTCVRAGQFGAGQLAIVDGVEECRRGVRLQVRRGARCIKVMASGGVGSLDDDPRRAQFSPGELEVMVEEANRMGLSVAAHVHGKAGILAAIHAGMATVEHVSFADEECIALMKERGTIYVATRAVVDLLLDTGGEGMDPRLWRKLNMIAGSHARAYEMAVRAGLTIALGTDTPPGFNHAMELEYAVKAGMSNLEAIKAATANGPLTLGEQAPRSGQLKVGYDADVLGLTENPVEDVKVLQDKEVIKWVWKGGRLFKGPGVGPWGEDDKQSKPF